jgi:hypothetical protein
MNPPVEGRLAGARKTGHLNPMTLDEWRQANAAGARVPVVSL